MSTDTLETHDVSMPVWKATVIGLVPTVFVVTVVFFIYERIWVEKSLMEDFVRMSEDMWTYVAILTVGVVTHELLHAISWILAGRASWKAIQFGFHWKSLSPYTHLQEPIDPRAYACGVMVPGLALGLLPMLFGVMLGYGTWVWFGGLMTVAACGDVAVWFLLLRLRLPSGYKVQDHPSKVGFFVVAPQ